MKRRLRLFLNKFGYLQIDFAFVVLIFFFFFYFIYSEQSFTNEYFRTIDDVNLLSSNARDICFLLTKSSGYPKNWENDLNNFDYIGLKNINTNFLDTNKLAVFTQTNYFDIVDSLNILGYVNINILGLQTGSNYLNFGNFSIKGDLLSSSTCFSNYNNEVVKVLVEVWR